jgi:hypothetical protein
MTMEDFEKVKTNMAQKQIERDEKLSTLLSSEQDIFFAKSVLILQRFRRGYVGRQKSKAANMHRTYVLTLSSGVILFQAVIRARQSRVRSKMLREILAKNIMRGTEVIRIQSFFRGYNGRKYIVLLRKNNSAGDIQRCFRGLLGRLVADKERRLLDLIRCKEQSAVLIQSCWRMKVYIYVYIYVYAYIYIYLYIYIYTMKVAKEDFRSMRVHGLAAQEIQRCFRGFTGRKQMERTRKWEAAVPGPERYLYMYPQAP